MARLFVITARDEPTAVILRRGPSDWYHVIQWHTRRADLRPGLTGPWQIAGRSHIPFTEMIKFDYQYVAGWSLARDIEILLATIPAVISGRGAY